MWCVLLPTVRSTTEGLPPVPTRSKQTREGREAACICDAPGKPKVPVPEVAVSLLAYHIKGAAGSPLRSEGYGGGLLPMKQV